MARLAILLGLAELRRAPIEAGKVDWRLSPKNMRLHGMRSALSIHHVKPGKGMLSHGSIRGSSDSRSSVHEDMAMDLDNDNDEWVRGS